MATPSLTLPDLEARSAEDVIRWSAEEFGDRLCLTCSWQKQSSVLVHMVSELGLGIDAHGNSLYRDVQTQAKAKLEEIFARL